MLRMNWECFKSVRRNDFKMTKKSITMIHLFSTIINISNLEIIHPNSWCWDWQLNTNSKRLILVALLKSSLMHNLFNLFCWFMLLLMHWFIVVPTTKQDNAKHKLVKLDNFNLVFELLYYDIVLITTSGFNKHTIYYLEINLLINFQIIIINKNINDHKEFVL